MLEDSGELDEKGENDAPYQDVVEDFPFVPVRIKALRILATRSGNS
jgi:hypothetical protein